VCAAVKAKVRDRTGQGRAEQSRALFAPRVEGRPVAAASKGRGTGSEPGRAAKLCLDRRKGRA